MDEDRKAMAKHRHRLHAGALRHARISQTASANPSASAGKAALGGDLMKMLCACASAPRGRRRAHARQDLRPETSRADAEQRVVGGGVESDARTRVAVMTPGFRATDALFGRREAEVSSTQSPRLPR